LPSVPVLRQRAGEQLFHEEARCRVETVAVDLGYNGENTRGGRQPELAREQTDVVVILARPVGEHLHRKEDPG